VVATAPQEGDVRLAQLPGISVATQPCDDVHFGEVEIFNAGQWGLVCENPDDGSSLVLAKVICQQLGFPFSSLLDRAPDQFDSVSATPVAVREVRCTGKESRLADCLLPSDGGQSSEEPCQVNLAVICRRFEIEGAICPVPFHVEHVGFWHACRLFDLRGSQQVACASLPFPFGNCSFAWSQ